MSMSKRVKIYTSADVETHATASSCWVSRRGKVYDITNFVADHPGGEDIILKHAGKDMEGVMNDPLEHEHSESAYEMLDEYLIGRIGVGEEIVKEDWEATDDFHADDTNVDEDYVKNEFLDLRKPLIMQVWRGNFSKSYYLKQVHQPRHLPHSARLFGPSYLEVFTVTAWYVVPTVWIPIAAYLFLRSAFQFTGPLPPFRSQPALPLSAISQITPEAFTKTLLCFLVGNFIWTFVEYLFHRFVFHLDELLPDQPAFILLHFLMHGVHHYLPMDRLRLVMPPILFATLQMPLTHLAHVILPAAVANGIISGAFTFYVLYDLTHYALHHTQLPAYFRELKKYHLAHHYKNYELGFGVTSKLWDVVFGTTLKI